MILRLITLVLKCRIWGMELGAQEFQSFLHSKINTGTPYNQFLTPYSVPPSSLHWHVPILFFWETQYTEFGNIKQLFCTLIKQYTHTPIDIYFFFDYISMRCIKGQKNSKKKIFYLMEKGYFGKLIILYFVESKFDDL